MTEESLKAQVSISNNVTLKAVYEQCCEEYRRRLCEMWEIWFDNTSWQGGNDSFEHGSLYIDLIGGVYLDITQIRFIVDNNISCGAFLSYWDYLSEHKYAPNMYNWFIKGLRPKGYEKE